MLSEFKNFVLKNRLFSKKDKLLLAISGGMDSVCLFHLLLQNNYHFSVAHCNFGLRGEDSNKDQAFVMKLSEKYGIKVHCIGFDTMNESVRLGTGIQETARKLRYDWFESVRITEGYDFILTAHHLSDNTETMLINILRSTGISGLHGIPVKKDYLIRPLMFTDRETIHGFIKSRRFKYRNDNSNQSDAYLRNRIRHHIIPGFISVEKETDKIFYTVASHLGAYESFSENLLEVHWNAHTEKKQNGFFINDSAFIGIHNPEIMLYYMLKSFGFTRSSVNAIQTSKILQTGKRIEASNWVLMRERNGYSLAEKREALQQSILIPQGTKKIKKGIFELNIKIINPIDVDYKATNVMYFDTSRCKFPLELRTWKKADKMTPIGMKGSKKISDILTDRKIEHSLRQSQLVLAGSDGTIMALWPILCSEKMKVMTKTVSVLAVSLKIR